MGGQDNIPRMWAISDMHWSTRQPMERFNDRWANHRERLSQNWRQRISLCDLVLVPGDLSFLDKDAHVDLSLLNSLPGQKVFVPGNHDRWTEGISRQKLQAVMSGYPTIHYLDYHRPLYETGNYLIVGYKGSEPPEIARHSKQKFNKTLQHAKNAVDHALQALSSYHTVIVTTHYAPSEQEREIMSVLEPTLWIHGHAHVGGDDADLVAEWEATRANPQQRCVSSDYLHQIPLEITGGVIHPHL